MITIKSYSTIESNRIDYPSERELSYPCKNTFDKCFISGGGGGGTTKQDTSYSRAGTSDTRRNIGLPDFLTNILQQNVSSAQVNPSTTAAQETFLSGLMAKDNSNVLDGDRLKSNYQIDPTTFQGSDTLQSLANQDLGSSAYEDATGASYEDKVRQALAQVETGPDAVRGGTARSAITRGDVVDRMSQNRAGEIRTQKLQDSGLAIQAAQTLAAIESGRRALAIGGQDQLMKQYLQGQGQSLEASRGIDSMRTINTGTTALAAQQLGEERQLTTDDLKGKGNQSGSSSNWGVQGGVTCCFIFMEAYHGEMPEHVRECRDVYYRKFPQIARGYTKMAKWLVPFMQKSNTVRKLVWNFMIVPLTQHGAFIKRENNSTSHKNYRTFWFMVWNFLGKEKQ